jgi:Holliday junction DNA helicase RuvA
LTVLSGVEAPELFEIMNTEDHARLVSIPGIGRKTAERMIVELKDKMGKVDAAASAGADGAGPERDAVLALVSLGYSRKDSEAAVKQVRGEGDGALEGIIRRSLAKLS